MITLERHKLSPLERSLPRNLYYSTNPDIAKKLIIVKRTRKKLLAVRRVLYFESSKLKDSSVLREAFRQRIAALEGSYASIVLPDREVLFCIPRKRRLHSYENQQRLSQCPGTNSTR